MCTVGLYVSLCLMIFLCPFLHCKALRTAMYKRYINSIIIIIIIIIKETWSLAAHHQSLASTLRKTKRLRRRLLQFCYLILYT